MEIKHTLHNVAFEWDGQKAAASYRKHRVSFELACEAFFDPFVCYLGDELVEDEQRETIIGLTTTWKLLFVAYVERFDVFRIISARLATKKEREIYENQ